jgi:hypothetical protein
LNNQINNYRSEYDNKVSEIVQFRSDLDKYKALLNEANEKLRTDRGRYVQDVSSASRGDDMAPSRSEYKANFKLDAKTPVFHSKLDEDIESWIIRIEASPTLANVPIALWITACYNYVEGIALQMVIAAKKDNKSWNDFKDILVKTFRPIYKDYDNILIYYDPPSC